LPQLQGSLRRPSQRFLVGVVVVVEVAVVVAVEVEVGVE
jgi:hypothetical protein